MLSEKHRFRAMLGGRKVAQSATACLLLMTKGNLATLTVGHWITAGKTGCLGAVFAVLLTFTPIANLYANKWTLAAIAGLSTVLADWLGHASSLSKLSAPTTEAVLTGVGAFGLSAIVSMTPIGAHIEKLAAKLKDPP